MRRMSPKELERLAVERGGVVRGVKLAQEPMPSTRYGSHIITIADWLPPSLNRTMRGELKARIKIGKATHEIVAHAVYHQMIPMATTCRQVQLVLNFPDQKARHDPDNLAKSILDSLVQCGMLKSDAYEFSEWLPPVYWFGPKQTEIHLRDIPVKVVQRRDSG